MLDWIFEGIINWISSIVSQMIKTIGMDAVEAELCPERRNLFGG